MPDGERVTTGSEPRRFGLWVCPVCARPDNAAGQRLCRFGCALTQLVEVQEVVEPGHDEQTEDEAKKARAAQRAHPNERQPRFSPYCGACGDELARVRAESWQPDPRTVAAVVKALRRWAEGQRALWRHQQCHAASELSANYAEGYADAMEEVLRFKPSAPGGDTGPVA